MIRSFFSQAKMAVFTMHSSPICPACRSVLMAAEHLNVKLDVKDYDLSTGEHKTPEFRKMNPQQTVPTIDDNGFYLWESRAVLTYLVNKYAPDSSIYPKDPQERAVVDRMLYFDIGTLYRTQAAILRSKIFKGKDADPEKQEAYQNALKLFDEMLEKTPYAAGNHITVADFSIISTLATAQLIDITFDSHPHISAWMKKLKLEIPSYIEINDVPLQKHKERLKSKI